MLIQKVVKELATIRGYPSIEEMVGYKDYPQLAAFIYNKDFRFFHNTTITKINWVADILNVTPVFIIRIVRMDFLKEAIWDKKKLKNNLKR